MARDTNYQGIEAVLYARVSSDEQEKEGFSIPAQQKLLRGYAADNGIRVLREFVDVETAIGPEGTRCLPSRPPFHSGPSQTAPDHAHVGIEGLVMALEVTELNGRIGVQDETVRGYSMGPPPTLRPVWRTGRRLHLPAAAQGADAARETDGPPRRRETEEGQGRNRGPRLAG